MNKGVVSYQCSCVGINFKNYKIEINSPPLVGFKIEAGDNFLKVDVEVVDIYEESTAFELAYAAASKLLDHICLKFLVKIGELHKVFISLPQKEGADVCLKVHDVYQSSFIEHVQLQYSPDSKCLDSLKKQIEDRWNNTSVLNGLFRNSISQEDPVTRYLLLYNLLLFANSDKQKKLDQCVRKIDPNVTVTSSPMDGKSETIYTRLRNEIAHARQGIEIQKTIIEITKYLPKFTDIVKQAVLSS